MINDLLFVYGTLLIADNEFATYLNQHSILLEKGIIQGRLYDVGTYPALIVDDTTNYSITGSICRLTDPESVLTVLDPYEGIGPDEEQPYLYVRKLLPVSTDNGVVECWVYIYNRSVDNLAEIKSGDYLRYIKL